jgi:inositol transport system substrate-binding protein
MTSKRLRRSLIVAVCLLSLFGFWLYFSRAFSAPEAPEKPEPPIRAQKTIALVVDDMQNPVTAELVMWIRQLVNDNENLRAMILDAQGLRSRQAAQLDQLDRSTLSGVILLPVSTMADLDVSISKLNQDGVAVVVLNQPETGLPGLSARVERIGFDALEAGRQQALFCARQLDGQGQVVILAGPREQGVALQMLSGVQAVFEEYPGLSIVAVQHGDWSRKSGTIGMIRSLQKHADIQAVLAQSDEMLLGALPIITGQGDQIVKVGLGATSEGLRILSQEFIDATVSINSRQLARAAWGAVMAAMNGERASDENVQPLLIDSSNLDAYVRDIWNIK